MAKRRAKKKPGKAPNARQRAATRVVRRPAPKAKKATKNVKETRTARRKRAKAPVATLRTPPSSLDMNRDATAARSGRQAMAENQRRHAKMGALTGGDVDADVESAYFTGDEVPGGENPTPDQQDVDETGHALGVEYQDNQELEGGEEVAERDKHRWENE